MTEARRTVAEFIKIDSSYLIQLDPPALFERLQSNLPYEETRQYVLKVAGYRKQFIGAPSAPATAMQQGVRDRAETPGHQQSISR
jgi:hypothetical protein